MPGLLIKNVPVPLHRRLKETAARHRRSMTREAIVILEDALGGEALRGEWPAPFKGSFPLAKNLIDKAKRTGRQ